MELLRVLSVILLLFAVGGAMDICKGWKKPEHSEDVMLIILFFGLSIGLFCLT